MRLGVVVLCVVAACGDDASGPVASYQLPASGAIDWGVAPFPNDVFLASDGTVELGSMPSDTPLWETVRMSLQTRRGFCGTCAIWFPIAGEIDPTTLGDGAVMIDERGERLAIDIQWDATSHVIAVHPKRGIVPLAGERYTVALLTSIKGVDGAALRADSGMTSTRAKVVTTPALALLAAAGIEANEVAAVTVFTVEDPTLLARDLAARVSAYLAAHGPPSLAVTHVWKASDGTLDGLMGIPAEDRPGVDVPAMAGQQGTLAISHSSISIVVKGTFHSVRAITGAGLELGTLRPDIADGEDVPFLLAIPVGADVANLPVVVLHHGLGGNMNTGIGVADAVAKAGCALLTLDAFNHGERAMGATDTAHAMRGDTGTLGPDGVYESTQLTVAFRMLAINGTPAGQGASPYYVQGGLAQMVADLHVLLRVVQASDLAPIAAADASLANLAFDHDRVYFIGASLGTLIGTATLLADTTVKAAVLNVPVGGLVSTLVENELFRTQFELVMSMFDVPNVQYEPELQLSNEPHVGFYQWTVHPLEPAALVRALVARPSLDILWQIAGLDELAGVPSSDHLIAAAGVPGIGTFAHATVTPGTAPLAGRGAVVFPTADHFMALSNAGGSANKPPGLPPFERRPTMLMFENPVAGVHDQMRHFFETKRLTGTGEILAP